MTYAKMQSARVPSWCRYEVRKDVEASEQGPAEYVPYVELVGRTEPRPFVWDFPGRRFSSRSAARRFLARFVNTMCAPSPRRRYVPSF